MTDTKGYVYLCMTLHAWGSGLTEREAINRCRSYAGTSTMQKHGYKTWLVHKDFEVDQVNGTIYTPVDHPAVVVTDKVKKKEKV